MRLRSLALALVAGAFLAAPALAAPASGPAIVAAIAGNTVQGDMGGTAYAEFYAADGTIKGKDYAGVWSIDGDNMCFQYGSDPAACWQVAKEGDQIQWVKDGKVDGTGTIVMGNPNNF